MLLLFIQLHSASIRQGTVCPAALRFQFFEHCRCPIDLIRLTGDHPCFLQRANHRLRNPEASGYDFHRKLRLFDQSFQKPCPRTLMFFSKHFQKFQRLLLWNRSHDPLFLFRRGLFPKRKHRAQRLHRGGTIIIPDPERQCSQFRLRTDKIGFNPSDPFQLFRRAGRVLCDLQHIPFFQMVTAPKRDFHHISGFQYTFQFFRHFVLKCLIQTTV